jgi:glycerol-3-phosphate dehydrogenase
MNKIKNKQKFEAIVIGTGITGGWASSVSFL